MKHLVMIVWVPAFFLATELFAQTEFSIMTYNVENLFDDQDDVNRADETYLPLNTKASRSHKETCKAIKNFKFRKDCYRLDWNQSVIDKKMTNLSNVILSVDQGRGPDILILAEVENQRVLKQFNDRFLKVADYKTIQLIEGEDARGIDLAVLSRFGMDGSSQLVSLNLDQKTRGVLKVPLKIKNEVRLTVFAVHLPSQGSPTSARMLALKNLTQILKNESSPWIVGGDFNITDKENQEFRLIENFLLPLGDVSHYLGCKACSGTHNYKGKWSFLDLLYFDHRLKKAGITVDAASIKVVKQDAMLGRKNQPKRFDPDKGQGASDHLPLYSRLFVQKKNK